MLFYSFLAVLAWLICSAASKPVPAAALEQRDLATRNDLFDLDCRPVTLIFGEYYHQTWIVKAANQAPHQLVVLSNQAMSVC